MATVCILLRSRARQCGVDVLWPSPHRSQAGRYSLTVQVGEPGSEQLPGLPFGLLCREGNAHQWSRLPTWGLEPARAVWRVLGTEGGGQQAGMPPCLGSSRWLIHILAQEGSQSP